MVKFLILIGILFLTVLVVAVTRPLIFEQIVPTVLGWEGDEAMPTDRVAPDEIPEISTPAPTATASPTVPPATSTPPPTATLQVYLVQPGDTLTRIADRFGVSMETLIDANNLANPNQLLPGDRLIIP
jgi:LysM repeat protein